MKILVTGAAGFIGYHLCKRLINDGHQVFGIDNLNHYYDVNLKLDRLNELGIDKIEVQRKSKEIKSRNNNFKFKILDLINFSDLNQLFINNHFEIVFNMAAQAGVRFSIEEPKVYVNSNLVGFANLLEVIKYHNIKHLIYASSSSVYGNSTNVPFKESDNVDKPISFYAATKKSNELMAYSYSHLFNIPMTGLRFFTVYGEWGRPDMASMLFAKSILNNEPIKIFNNGNLSRDFTYINDIIEGIIKVMNRFNSTTIDPSNLEIEIRHKIYNIGSCNPINLMEFIKIIEDKIGITAIKEYVTNQPGDVFQTYADVSEIIKDTNYSPKTSLKEGISNFINWYLNYYNKLNNE